MGDIYHAGEVYAGSVPIDDTQASEETVYSSAKVESRLKDVGEIGYSQGTTTSISASTWTDIITKTFTTSEYGTYIISAQANNHNSDENAKYIQIQGAPLGLSANVKTTQLYQSLTGIFTVDANSPTVKLRAYSATASTVDNATMVWAKLN